jgi:hypothetical protein
VTELFSINQKNCTHVLSDVLAFFEKVFDKSDKEFYITVEDKKQKRSVLISTHFHAHVTNIYSYLVYECGVPITREQVYFEILLLACEIEPPEGGSPYPYIIIERDIGNGMIAEVLEPYRTTHTTNKQMMTAVEACHRYGAQTITEKYGVPGFTCPEKEEWFECEK